MMTHTDAVKLLKSLIAIPSVSRDEKAAADFLEEHLKQLQLFPMRHHNNLWCVGRAQLSNRPTLLLNAHIDTVKPAAGWQCDPFTPLLEGERLYGLGSNDCGGGLVSLLAVFTQLEKRTDIPWNLVFLASAEEEVSGKNGIESVIPLLPHIDCAIVGEPTGMQPAIAEKGLMVLDCTAHGRAGHAARNEGDNAIYHAIDDIQWVRTFQFPDVSPLLGPVKMSVTIVQAGTQHNVVPDACTFTIDVRSNECYTNQMLLEEISAHLQSDVKARSTRLSSSSVSPTHPLVLRAEALGRRPFGSPTLSDQALMPWPSLKMGPGESSRSHTAGEYIGLQEIEEGIALYLKLLE